ncbi:hypothetical protein HDU89_006896 [Geranomyces variabilis]|nr:hypothetical protein HDU89_006896 [Geranomyces variabilis]
MLASDAITVDFDPSLGERKACPEVLRKKMADAQEVSADFSQEVPTKPAVLSGQGAEVWEYVTQSQKTVQTDPRPFGLESLAAGVLALPNVVIPVIYDIQQFQIQPGQQKMGGLKTEDCDAQDSQ